MEKIMPEGPYCCDLHIFGVSTACPGLDAKITKVPKCCKFDTELGWTASGRILKCQECLDSK